jgi:oligosaccharide repeat unit polymerase
MLAALFCFSLLAFYFLFLRKRNRLENPLALSLWLVYFALGCAGIAIAVTNTETSIFDPNYFSALFLSLCIVIGITGFLGFRSRDLNEVLTDIRGQKFIEMVLVGIQSLAILFFLPFAFSSLEGDANINRLDVSNKAFLLGTYGLINTFASMASHLFPVSLVMAFIRLSQSKDRGGSVLPAVLLALSSLSYVVYVLAYVGRDGVVYWIMTAGVIFLMFRSYLPEKRRRQVVIGGSTVVAFIIIPLAIITVARFAGSDVGVGQSILDYFGSQIQTFSDFSSINRPKTYGVMNFPIFMDAACSTFMSGCEKWEYIKIYVFDQYLVQGKAPWLFGTYVSDFVADFGYLGTLVALSAFSLICHFTCSGRDTAGRLSISRFLLILFFFLVPYWGVFYFRFGIANASIIANLAFIIFVWLVQRFTSTESTREFPYRPTSESYMPRR